jgi:superfamily II DNA or RNA helicase
MALLRFDRGTLVLDGLSAAEDAACAAQPPYGFLMDPRVGHYRAPAYRYRTAVASLRERGISLSDRAPAYRRLRLQVAVAPVSPYPHQQEALAAWEARERRGVVVLPTGSGKTYVAEAAIARTGRSTLVVVPTLDLMTQWYDRLSTAFAPTEIGLIGGKFYEPRDLTVTTYDSAYMHMDRLGNRWGLLVFDECHHLPGQSYVYAAEFSLAPYRLGLTATLERADGRHTLLEDLIGPTLYQKQIRELSGDYLAAYTVRRLKVSLTAQERAAYEEARAQRNAFLREAGIVLGTQAGWHAFVRASATSSAGRQAMLAHQAMRRLALGTEAKLRALDGLLRQHATDRLLVFTHDTATAQTISRSFLLPSISHQTDAKERRALLEGFRAGTYRALVSAQVLNEGVDLPAANVGIVLAGSASVREHVQRLGRLLRRVQDKEAILYEVISQNTMEEGASRRRRQHDAYRQGTAGD